jgi:hypothetical protein
MSFEHFGTPSPPLDQATINVFLDGVINSGLWRLIWRTESELGLAGTQADVNWPETIVIRVQPEEVCVEFHIPTGNEREQLIEYLEHLFRNIGIECRLCEE